MAGPVTHVKLLGLHKLVAARLNGVLDFFRLDGPALNQEAARPPRRCE